MHPAPMWAAQPLDVACDESGSEGEKLIGGTTDVFAHGSVSIDLDTATSCIARLRVWTRSPATEYKASVILRDQNRPALRWLLGPLGPLHGHAHVHLTEKSVLAVRALALVLLTDPTSRAEGERAAYEVAADLYREGPLAYGEKRWSDYLSAFNEVMRAKSADDEEVLAKTFAQLTDELAQAVPPRLADTMNRLNDACDDILPTLERWLDTTYVASPLEALFPALEVSVAHWTSNGRDVRLIHDQQQALTPPRLATLRERHNVKALRANGSGPIGAVSEIVLVDSMDDPRVQVADLLAGAARRIAEETLNGRRETDLIALLRPYLDERSTWADPVSRLHLFANSAG